MSGLSPVRDKYISIRTAYGRSQEEGSGPNLSHPDSEYKILLACRLGEYCIPDMRELEPIGSEFRADAIAMGLTQDLDYLVKMFKHSIYVSAYYTHGVPLSSQGIKNEGYLVLALYLYDNLVDGDTLSEGSPYEDLKQMKTIIMDVLRDSALDSSRLEGIHFQGKEDVVKLFQKFHQMSCESIQNYRGVNGKFLDQVEEHLEAQCWILLDKDYSTNTFLFRRERASGGYFTFEYSRLVREIPLSSREFKNSPIMNQFIGCAVRAAVLVNDLFSWERERSGTDGQNYCQAKMKEGWTLPRIAVHMVDLINQNVKEMTRLGILIEQTSEDVNIARYTLHVRQVVDGNVYLHIDCPRYSKYLKRGDTPSAG